jgi:hypothetical protein
MPAVPAVMDGPDFVTNVPFSGLEWSHPRVDVLMTGEESARIRAPSEHSLGS